MTNIKLVISGSGTRFPIFVGAIKNLNDRGYHITEACGTSGGALIAAALASGMDNKNMTDFCHELLINYKKYADPSLFSLFWNWGLISGNKLENRLKGVFVSTFSEATIPVKIITVDYDNANIEAPYNVFSTEISPKVSLARAVRASMSSPLVFKPVVINGNRHIDGGIVANYPLDIYGETAKDVIGLYIAPIKSGKTSRKRNRGAAGLAQYIIDITDIFIYAATKEYVEDNKNAQSIPLRTEYTTMDFSLSIKDIDKMIVQGYESVDRYFNT